ncbi:netrin receptor UNC5C [Schistocerca gregaria]|uniref:netrin receptor UNC5C n=1 Tax=Schistocerca gregaria TaxID=7010 RepID=UPI00211F2B10|nr:netrin receptor UNC5C [Schistocerca gregaria]XP_049839248.1 netrin receptor UNC5C [Schistocerca gregaria]
MTAAQLALLLALLLPLSRLQEPEGAAAAAAAVGGAVAASPPAVEAAATAGVLAAAAAAGAAGASSASGPDEHHIDDDDDDDDDDLDDGLEDDERDGGGLLLLPAPGVGLAGGGSAPGGGGDGADAGTPYFLSEPAPAFVVKQRAATLSCKAANALTLHFRCTDGARRNPTRQSEHVDPQSGVRVVEASLDVSREDVEEFFGRDKLKCECVAWSSRGQAKSQPAAVDVAYLRKQFETSPYGRAVRLGAGAELRCLPPAGVPPPRVYWLRNGAPLEPDSNVIVSSEGHLLLGQARLQDTANYTCVAENVAARRLSEPALLTVYVDGGWSAWSSWGECSASRCGQRGVVRRTRSCSSPAPLNGGQPCPGTAVQKAECIGPCPPQQPEASTVVDGRWSPWSPWSVCGPDCRQQRHRACTSPPPSNGGRFCPGRDTAVADCAGGLCRLSAGNQAEAAGSHDSVQLSEEAVHPPDVALYVGLAVAMVVFALMAAAGGYRWLWRRKGARAGGAGGGLYSPASAGDVAAGALAADPEKRRLQPDLTQTAVIAAACYEYPYSEPPPPPPGALSHDDDEEEHHYDEPLRPGGSTSSLSSAGTASVLQASLEPELSAAGVATAAGARLELPELGVALTVPQGGVARGRRQRVLVALLRDARPPLPDGCVRLSPVVMCGPLRLELAKPLILSFQHCAAPPHDAWRLSVWCCDTPPGQPPFWQEEAVLGEETINTAVYAQLDPGRVHLACEAGTRCVLVGRPARPRAARKSLRLALFGPPVPPLVALPNCSLRVYVLEDTREALQSVEREEATLGAQLLDLPRTLHFEDGGGPLILSLEDVGPGWHSKPQAGHQEIPFQHVWNPSHGHLHCSFSLERSTVPQQPLSLSVAACQQGNNSKVVLRVQPDLGAVPLTPGLTTLTVTTSSGCSSLRSSPASASHSPFRVPRAVCKQLAKSLDPPNARGNDWRMLARQLGVDRYINYFATKASPTEHILDLWEARHREPSAVPDLLNVLRLMGRSDAAALLERELGAWI